MTRSEALLISVVIPAYNYAHLLPRALDSVLGQLSDDVELIVVDDGSTDNTAAVLADYQARHAALQVISQVNAGAMTGNPRAGWKTPLPPCPAHTLRPCRGYVAGYRHVCRCAPAAWQSPPPEH